MTRESASIQWLPIGGWGKQRGELVCTRNPGKCSTSRSGCSSHYQTILLKNFLSWRVFILFGAPHIGNEGNPSTAEADLKNAISAIDNIPPHKRDAPILIQQAMAHRQLGALQQQRGNVDEAANSMQAALDALGYVKSQEDHNQKEHLSALADVLNSLAIVYRASGKYNEAEQTYRRVLSLYQIPDDLESLNPEIAHQVGITAINLGNILLRQRRHDDAREAYEKSARIFHRLRNDFPATISYQRMTARAELSLGTVYSALKDDEAAESAYRKAISQSETLQTLQGSDLTTLDTHAVSLTNLGNLLKKQDRIDEAIERFKQSIEMREQHALLQPGGLANLKSLALTKANLANAFMERSEYRQADVLLLEAEELIGKLLQANSDDPSFVRVGDFVFRLLAESASANGRYNEMAPWVQRRFQILIGIRQPLEEWSMH